MLDPFENLEIFEAYFGEELNDAPKGEVVIRLIEGGNEYMKVGDTKCGYTPGIKVGYHVWVQSPKGFFMTSEVQSIDFAAETFTCVQSTYHFHFVKK